MTEIHPYKKSNWRCSITYSRRGKTSFICQCPLQVLFVQSCVCCRLNSPKSNMWLQNKTMIMWFWHVYTPNLSCLSFSKPCSSLARFFSSSAFFSSFSVPSPSLYIRLALAQPHTCPSSQALLANFKAWVISGFSPLALPSIYKALRLKQEGAKPPAQAFS